MGEVAGVRGGGIREAGFGRSKRKLDEVLGWGSGGRESSMMGGSGW